MRASAAFLFVLFVLSHVANGQARVPASREFQITKITKNLVPTPDYGIGQYRATANVQSGAVKDELSLARAPAQWFAALPPISGFVLNKNETPFAPLYWDRYAQIKSR